MKFAVLNLKSHNDDKQKSRFQSFGNGFHSTIVVYSLKYVLFNILEIFVCAMLDFLASSFITYNNSMLVHLKS